MANKNEEKNMKHNESAVASSHSSQSVSVTPKVSVAARQAAMQTDISFFEKSS